MSLKAGIIGLPNVGKSTLFNAITNSQVEAANYPFATIEPNIGVVELIDKRLQKISEIVKPKKILYATFEFIDIAGLVKGASKGEGLGNKFLANIRGVDSLVQVIRCFENKDITHVEETIDPIRDVSIINLELLMADIETVQNIIKRTQKKAESSNDKIAKLEYRIANKLNDSFAKEIPAREVELNQEELLLVKGWQLLTLKPILYVGNVAEDFVSNPEENKIFKKLKKEVEKKGSKIIGISAKIEGELSQLFDEEKNIFLKELGIKKTGLSTITRATFELLNLATYFTAGKEEVKAWIFKKNDTAPKCAGIIHTDFERGFIKAQIISYKDYIDNNGEQGAKEAGKARLEGKNYIMKDGDICHFRFNV